MSTSSISSGSSSAKALPGASWDPVDDIEFFTERLVSDMHCRWGQGEEATVEEYLAHYPELAQRPEAAAELIYEEACLRRQRGEEVAVEAILSRFPQWRSKLAVLLECHRLLEREAPFFPVVGETVADFHLLAELGRGAQSRVFLAAEAALSERRLVVKFVPGTSAEHVSLSRLQHTHIMPLYTVKEVPDRHLRALCMPYFGGATLVELLEAMRDRPVGTRTGRHVLDILKRPHKADVNPTAATVQNALCRSLTQMSYVQAICWMGASLANALHYAQERCLVHLDVKPSNILWASDGQPLLLDFHLAREPLRADSQPPDWLGGTRRYMAPEQRRAFEAVQDNRPIPQDLDGRADLYALGLVLYEALAGEMPLPPRRPGLRLHRRHACVSRGLADILDKCLANEPRDRYVSAADLEADLRRHLADQPLAHVTNKSLWERWRKWRRRRPYAPALIALLMALGVSLGIFAIRAGRQQEQAQAALWEGQAQLDRQSYREAISCFKGGLALVVGLPGNTDLIQALRFRLARAERGQLLQDLHRFVDSIRRLDCTLLAVPADNVSTGDRANLGVQPGASAFGTMVGLASHSSIEAHCRELWAGRERFLRCLESANSPTSPELVLQTRSDLLDLAILTIDLRLKSGQPSDQLAIRREGLGTLADAEALFGPSCALARERERHAKALGLEDLAEKARQQAASLPPQTAWEHFALGRAYYRGGEPTIAAEYLETARSLQPQLLWAHFYMGQCAYIRARYADAVSAFTACLALEPESAGCFHNRAVSYQQLARTGDSNNYRARALRDYDRALQLDASLARTVLCRGILHYEVKDYPAALEDLGRALALGADSATVHYNEALVHLARGDETAARDSLYWVLRQDPGHIDARTLLMRLGDDDPPTD